MPKKIDPAQQREKLHKKVQDLATQVVLADDLARPLQTLQEIAEHARRAGEEQLGAEAAALRTALAESMAREDYGAGDAWEQVSQGVLRLQQALEDADKPPALEAAGGGGGPTALAQDPELVRDFVVESREHLAAIEAHLLLLEQNPAHLEPIHSVFRGFHTIKGLAGFLEFGAIQEVAHEVETVLDLARNQRLEVTAEVIDLVLKGADYLKVALDQVDATLSGKPLKEFAPNQELVGLLRSLVSGGGPPAAPSQDQADAPAAAAPAAAAESATAPAESEIRTIKVDTAKLDHLVDMVGEMVIAQSLLRHDKSLAADRSPRLQRTLSLLSGITSDVQKTAMGLRMITVGHLFRRMGRLVRDLARKTGKQVELVTSGEDTELDRQIVEDLADPFMHMVRNSIDHGLETPEERVAAGKPPCGKISLEAQHQSGQIVIHIADDGRGLDREKILRRARERGLVGEGATLSEAEIFALIFEPGFSTAERVTEVSGRGVGMDVVRRNISKMRGKVEVASRRNQGTTFTLKLPLTLAIIDGLIVAVGAQRYIIPIYTVVEMLRPRREDVTFAPGQGEMVLVRGSLVPVIRLHERFGVEARARHPSEGLLVVAEQEGKRFAVLVDDFIGKQEVVIKSLGPMFRHVQGVAGGAILGDGRVGLILDLEGIFVWKEGR